jgi:hypothetical protein
MISLVLIQRLHRKRGRGGKGGGDEEIFLCSGVKRMEIPIGHI